MSISLSRSPRDMSALRTASSTGNSVGPGSYDPKKPRGGPIAVYEEVKEDGTIETVELFKRGTEVPFQSLEEKFAVSNRANASKTPGPGTYAPMSCTKDCGRSAGYGLKSRSARLAPVAPGSSQYTTSTIVDNPGPGAYFGDDMIHGTSARRRSDPPLRIPTSRVSASIPVRRLLPGDTVNDSAIPAMDFTGDKGDTCGPDRYSIESARRVTCPGVRNAQWHKYREQRNVFKPNHSITNDLPDPMVPGPGQYHEMNHNNRKLPSLGTSQFRSRVPMAHQVVVCPEGKGFSQHGDDEFSTAANTATTTGGFTNTDGSYCGHYSSARVAIAAHKAAVAPFSSSVPRSDGWARTVEAPYTTPHRGGPGPGAYRHRPSSSLKDAVTVLARPGLAADNLSTRTIKHKLNTVEGVHVRMIDDPLVSIGQHRKYYGIHNPLNMAIVSEALDNRQPMISFNSTDGRPCNKPLLQTSPGPDQYANGEALSISKATISRATVGRKGVFGTCASRNAGSAFVENKDTHGKRKRHDLEEEMDNLQSPRMERKGANYRTVRVVRDNSMKRVVEPPVKCHGPGPTSYSPQQPEGGAYRNPYRLGRKDHLSFGSGNERFGSSGGVFRAADVPGPGQYSSTQRRQKPGGANTKSKRFGSGVVGVDYTAITSTDGAVGPGSYDQQRADSCSVMASKTHNVTMNTPWTQLKSANSRKAPHLIRFRGAGIPLTLTPFGSSSSMMNLMFLLSFFVFVFVVVYCIVVVLYYMGGPPPPSSNKKQLLQSSGIVPQGYRILDKATLNKIYFSTSTADSYRPRPIAEALAGQSESCKKIHQIDKELGHKVSQAPLYQRSMCAYYQDYIPRPLNGVIINRELYKIHKDNFAGSGGNVSGGSLSSDTTFRHFYPQHTVEEIMTARPKSCKPAVETHIDSEAKLLFKDSITHDHYPTPDTSGGIGVHEIHSRKKPKGASKMSRPMVKFPFQGSTSYVRDYYDRDFEYVKDTNIPLSANNVVTRSHANGVLDTYLGDYIAYV